MQDTPHTTPASARAAREVRENTPLRQARTCYDHLAGVAGVRLMEEMLRRRWLEPCEVSDQYRVTALGARELVGRGVDVYQARSSRRALARGCRDWTERHYHLGGALASEVLSALIADGFIQRPHKSREVTLLKPLDRWLDPV